MWSPTQYIWACQVLIPSVKTEVCFLISVSEPTLIGTWYDQIYCRWTTHKHTCNIFLVFGWVWSINRCGHAEWHLQTTTCKVCFLISVSAPTPISAQHDHSWQTNTYHLLYKVRVHFQAKAHQSLHIQHTDVFRIAAVFCVYWKPFRERYQSTGKVPNITLII